MPIPIVVAGAVAAGWAISKLFSEDSTKTEQPKQESDFRIGFLSIFLQVAETDEEMNEKEKAEILAALDQIFDTQVDDESFQIAKKNLLVGEALELSKKKPAIGNFILLSCLKIAACDGIVNEEEESLILDLARKIDQVDSLEDYSVFYFRNSFSIPVDNRKEQASRCLGLEPTADEAEIKKQYLKLSKDFHPDKLEALKLPQHLVDLSTDRFREISEAYNILCEKSALVHCFNNGEKQEAIPGAIAACLLCDQKLRLPESESILKARCPKCYFFLAFPSSL